MKNQAFSQSINTLIDKRNAARAKGDMDTAKEVEEQVDEMGIELADTQYGTVWCRKT